MAWTFPQTLHKPYIVPTVYGLAYFLLIMNVFSLGYFRSNAPFHTVGLTLIILGLVAMVHTNSNVLLVRASSLSHPLAEAGQTFRLPVTVQNLGRDSRYNIFLTLPAPFHLQATSSITEVFDQTRCELSLQFSERGVYEVQRIRITSRGIFGLFFAWKWCPLAAECIIYPRPTGAAPLPLSPHEQRLDHLEEEDFAGHRLYQEGSSLRRIDWKVLARSDRLLLKDFHSQKAHSVELHFEQTPGAHREAKLEQLTAWVFRAVSEERAFSLVLPHASLPMGQGSHHLEAALRILASCPREQT